MSLYFEVSLITLTARPRDWLFPVLIPIVALLGIGLSVQQCIRVAIIEAYSPGWQSPSSDAAMQAGVLQSRPHLADSTLMSRDGQIRVMDAWIEADTRIEYRLLFFRRVIPQGTHSLIVHAQMPAAAQWDLELGLLRSGSDVGGDLDTVPFSSRAPGRLYKMSLSIVPPFPDTIALAAYWKR